MNAVSFGDRMPLCVSCQNQSDSDVKLEQMADGETCSRCGFTRVGTGKRERRLRFYSLIFAWLGVIAVFLYMLLG